MHAGFYVLLTASAARYVAYHGADLLVLGLALGLGLAYPAGVRWTNALPVVLAVWLVLVWLAPSFGWCAIPLFFQCLRQLRPRVALPIAAVLTFAVVLAQIRLAAARSPSRRWRAGGCSARGLSSPTPARAARAGSCWSCSGRWQLRPRRRWA